MTISVVLNDKVLSPDEYEHVHILIEQASFLNFRQILKAILFLISFYTEYRWKLPPTTIQYRFTNTR